jgi:hypothetical protein
LAASRHAVLVLRYRRRFVWAVKRAGVVRSGRTAPFQLSEKELSEKSGQVLVRTMSPKSSEFPKNSGGMSGVLKLEAHHFHLVGNGQMVHLVRRALYGAGVARERVSIETYFDHHAEPDNAEIDKLTIQFRGSR